MEDHQSIGSRGHDGSKYQPKFKDCRLSEQADDRMLRRWITLIGSIVTNIAEGAQLEAFLNHALKRDVSKTATRPLSLQDAMFDIFNGSTTTPSKSDRSQQSGVTLRGTSPLSGASAMADSQATEDQKEDEGEDLLERERVRTHRGQRAVTEAELILNDALEGKDLQRCRSLQLVIAAVVCSSSSLPESAALQRCRSPRLTQFTRATEPNPCQIVLWM